MLFDICDIYTVDFDAVSETGGRVDHGFADDKIIYTPYSHIEQYFQT